MPGMAFAFDQTLVLTDDVLGNGQAEPGAVWATADHWVEKGVLELGRDAWPVVDDFDPRHEAMANVADGELAQRTSA